MPVTAAYLVRRTRELIALIEGTNQNFRDGFDGDDGGSPDPDKIPILPSIGDFINLCSLSGAKPRDVAIPVITGQRDYQTPDDVASVMQVYFNGKPVFEATREAMDRSDPLWRLGTGDPTRWFIEGDQVVLDNLPTGGLMSWRCAMTLDGLDPANPNSLTDSALSAVQVVRIPFGAAFLLMNIDTLNNSHARRLAEYKVIADGLLADISGRTHNRDTTRRVSLDNWYPDMQYPGAVPIYGKDDTDTTGVTQ